jgi:hypothetical protein
MLDHIPHLVASVILGWEMEAMSRLNLDIGDLDFSDSMAPVIKLRLNPPQGSKMEVKGGKRARRKSDSSK